MFVSSKSLHKTVYKALPFKPNERLLIRRSLFALKTSLSKNAKMSTMQYELHLNLQQRAALKIAISFWERKEVKDKVMVFFKSSEKLNNWDIRIEWGEFTKSVINECYKNELPRILEIELIHLVRMIGQTIFDWYRYIKYEYEATEEAISFINQIKWTPYGTVDVVKVFESSWLENPNLKITKVYNFACRYAITDHINELWNKIPADVQVNLYNDRINEQFDLHILRYWKYYRDNNLPDLIEYFQPIVNDIENDFYEGDVQELNFLWNFSFSIEANMLWLSVHQGYFIATKYFWEKLSEKEKDECVLTCARFAVLRYNNNIYSGAIENYKRSQYIEICIFLMNQMSNDHKKAFFNESMVLDKYDFCNKDVKDEILKMLLSIWPWQELFIPVLKDMIQYQDDYNCMYCVFLNKIMDEIVEDYKLGYSLETNKYRCLLREAWLIIPAFIKEKIPLLDDSDDEFVNNLILVWDLDNLKLILNDPAIAEIRDELIENGLGFYKKLIEADNFEQLDQFIEGIFTDEKEKKQFKQKVLEKLINKGYIDLADKLLDWQSSTPEERKSLKNDINYIKLCEYFIEDGEYDLADEFLNWKFDTEEEKKKCKDHLKKNHFSIHRVCEIWLEEDRSINSIIKECSQFLHWLFESEEEIALLKKSIAVNFESDESTMIYFTHFKYGGILDIFMSWCLLDDEHFQLAQSMKQAGI